MSKCADALPVKIKSFTIDTLLLNEKEIEPFPPMRREENIKIFGDAIDAKLGTTELDDENSKLPPSKMVKFWAPARTPPTRRGTVTLVEFAITSTLLLRTVNDKKSAVEKFGSDSAGKDTVGEPTGKSNPRTFIAAALVT